MASCPVAVVGMRVDRADARAPPSWTSFLEASPFPVVTHLRDTQTYVYCARDGRERVRPAALARRAGLGAVAAADALDREAGGGEGVAMQAAGESTAVSACWTLRMTRPSLRPRSRAARAHASLLRRVLRSLHGCFCTRPWSSRRQPAWLTLPPGRHPSWPGQRCSRHPSQPPRRHPPKPSPDRPPPGRLATRPCSAALAASFVASAAFFAASSVAFAAALAAFAAASAALVASAFALSACS